MLSLHATAAATANGIMTLINNKLLFLWIKINYSDNHQDFRYLTITHGITHILLCLKQNLAINRRLIVQHYLMYSTY